MLGTASWLLLLRALSQLERLQAQLLPGSKDGLPPLPEGAAAIMASASLDGVAAAAAAAAAAPPAALPPPPQAGSSFGRLLQRMGFSSSSEPSGGGGSPGGSGGGGRTGLLAIKDAPGAGHVLWAETAGERLGRGWVLRRGTAAELWPWPWLAARDEGKREKAAPCLSRRGFADPLSHPHR